MRGDETIGLCGWTYTRWDGYTVVCTLLVNHAPLVPWPKHAPNEPIIKPWKRIGGQSKR